MMDIDMASPVLVTGATGYVAGWLVQYLLDAGVTVHAAVRSPDDPEKVGPLRAMADGTPGEIRFFRADLLEEGSYGEAMAGCGVVFHTASPFTTEVDDPQRELVDPALLGTRNVLTEANRTPSVQRVVLTSSVAAIYCDNEDLEKTTNGVLTEKDWNTTASLDYNAYSYSKTLAEREAWLLEGAQDRWRLVVVNPSLVLGPAVRSGSSSESFNLMRQFGDGTMKMGAPRWGMGFVDVRDVARAHVAAGFEPDAGGRHIVSGHDSEFVELGRTLLEKYGDDYPIPTRALPKWLLWLVGPLMSDSMNRRSIARNVNLPIRLDNAKSIRELGVTYRPLKESAEAMFQYMIDAGYFDRDG